MCTGSAETIEEIRIEKVPKLGDHPSEVFAALSTLTHVKEMQLFDNNIRIIPPYAFRGDRLEKLEIDDQLDSIQNRAFYYLNNLQILTFADQGIKSIETQAFEFEKESNKSLQIHFNNNISSISSLKVGTFTSIKRPTNIYFNLEKLNFLPEAVFSQFLAADKRNELVFVGKLDYMKDRCVIAWLIRNSNQYLTQFGFEGYERNDDDFSHCKNRVYDKIEGENVVVREEYNEEENSFAKIPIVSISIIFAYLLFYAIMF